MEKWAGVRWNKRERRENEEIKENESWKEGIKSESERKTMK